MEIRLRKVIYSRSVEVSNVPVYSCAGCHRVKIFPEVKGELSRLIRGLGQKPEKDRLDFADVSEWAFLIAQATDRNRLNEPIQHIISDRVDQLLDLMLLARSLSDFEWEEDLRSRLGQITRPVAAT